MLGVLMLFLLPVGGGIPAGVLLAQAKGQSWQLTAGLYLLSDVILALLFEPLLRGLVRMGASRPGLARFGAAMKEATARTVAQMGGGLSGPLSLILVSFGADPMTGRTAALAAGHGLWSGWAFAIVGDLLYYALVALVTLRLNTLIKNPTATAFLVLLAMLALPALLRRLRSGFRTQQTA